MFIVVFLFRHMHHHHHHHHGSTNTKYLAWLSLCTCVSSVFSNENSQLTNLFCVRVVLHYCRSYVKTYEVQTFWSFSELELWEPFPFPSFVFFLSYLPVSQSHHIGPRWEYETNTQSVLFFWREYFFSTMLSPLQYHFNLAHCNLPYRWDSRQDSRHIPTMNHQ